MKIKKVVSLLLAVIFVFSLSTAAVANDKSFEEISDELLQKEDIALVREDVTKLMLNDNISGIDTLEEVVVFLDILRNNPELAPFPKENESRRDHPVASVIDNVVINGRDSRITVFENGDVLIFSMTAELIDDRYDLDEYTPADEYTHPNQSPKYEDPPESSMSNPTPTISESISIAEKEELNTGSPIDSTIRIEIDGKYINTDVKPFIDEYSRTQAPFRIVGESLGCVVEWNEADRKVTCTKEGVMVEMFIGDVNYLVNGDLKVMDTAPQIKDGRTFIPVRALGEALSCSVTWHPDTLLLSIVSTGF